MPLLPVGAEAPDFELDGSTGKVRLSDLLRQTDFVILAFFPASFSPVCTNELNLYQEVKDEFTRLGAQVVGISVDGRYTQQAFAKANGIAFPILADFHPKGEVAREYGVMRDDGMAERALYIIDRSRKVRYSYLSEIRENPGADRLLDALEAMQGERG